MSDEAPSIDTMKRLFFLRGILDMVNHASYAFSVINKQNPTAKLNEEQALKMIQAYEDMITQITSELDKYSNDLTFSEDYVNRA